MTVRARLLEKILLRLNPSEKEMLSPSRPEGINATYLFTELQGLSLLLTFPKC